MPSQLWRLCVCHLLTWFSIIAEAVFYTDFMGQVIFQGDPKVYTQAHTYRYLPNPICIVVETLPDIIWYFVFLGNHTVVQWT